MNDDNGSPTALAILLVEDDRADARLVQGQLAEAQSTEVTWVTRMGPALEALERRAFDLVLLDLGLPDAQGFDGLARVLETQPPVPVVVLTGLDDEVAALAALEHGAQDYLVKGSIDGDLLRRTIRYSVERHRVQQALYEHEELYQSLVDSIPEIVYSRDLDGHVSFIGAKADVICDGRQKLYRRERSWYDLLHPADGERVVRELRAAIGDRQEFKLEYRVVDANGRLHWFVDHGRGVRDAGGAIERIDGILFDITERKRQEELREAELKATRDALEQIQRSSSARHSDTPVESIEGHDDIAALELEYDRALEAYIGERRERRATDADFARRFADRLASLRATPNDLVQVHLNALEQRTDCSDDRVAAFGRLLLLEVMGCLAERYRQLALGSARPTRDAGAR